MVLINSRKSLLMKFNNFKKLRKFAILIKLLKDETLIKDSFINGPNVYHKANCYCAVNSMLN